VRDRIRRATAGDQAAISRLVRQARLNPRDLDSRRFVIAEAGASPIGVAQVRRHADGARELASLVVLSEHRDRGVAASMIDRAADRAGSGFTLVDRRYAQHFKRWDFHRVEPADLPVDGPGAADRPTGGSDRVAADQPPDPPPAATPATPRPRRLTTASQRRPHRRVSGGTRHVRTCVGVRSR
jgi:N-acetylglutamate synthase-like GNAT family acetyltransferase